MSKPTLDGVLIHHRGNVIPFPEFEAYFHRLAREDAAEAAMLIRKVILDWAEHMEGKHGEIPAEFRPMVDRARAANVSKH